MLKSKIQQEILNSIEQFIQEASSVDDANFFLQINNRWSVAENVVHLVLSVKPINMALSLPHFILKVFGIPNRPIMSYEEVVKKYTDALKNGAVATNDYIPKKNKKSKEEVLKKLTTSYNTLGLKIEKWAEDDLDNYLLPHPIIGKITVREMLYFTIYHIQHHTATIAQAKNQ